MIHNPLVAGSSPAGPTAWKGGCRGKRPKNQGFRAVAGIGFAGFFVQRRARKESSTGKAFCGGGRHPTDKGLCNAFSYSQKAEAVMEKKPADMIQAVSIRDRRNRDGYCIG